MHTKTSHNRQYEPLEQIRWINFPVDHILSVTNELGLSWKYPSRPSFWNSYNLSIL